MNIISNLFSSIKNGYLVKKTLITQTNSKFSKNILSVLAKEGFIRSYKIISERKINIFLKYRKNESVLKELKLVSKPSKRIYIKNKELFLKKQGFYIISTSSGVLNDLEAKKLNKGGEFICKIF